MKKNMNAYQKYLYRLSMVLIILYSVELVARLALPHIMEPLPCCLLAILAGLISLYCARSGKYRGIFIVTLGLIILAMAYLLVYYKNHVDALISVSLFLVGLVFYLLLLEYTQERKWERVCKQEPNALDLRVTGKDTLFDALIMAPHLEMNSDILTAVDRFLGTADRVAPLQLYIHSAERISVPLQETMREVFSAHYEDEEQRINHFLESRFGRAIWLIVVSVCALQLLNLAVGGEVHGIVWTIVSNFAGFSLWQIGSTFFERSQAMQELMRVRIAQSAEISFL